MTDDSREPLTANQKKKLRQRRSKIGKRHRSSQTEPGSTQAFEGSCSVNDSRRTSFHQSFGTAESSTTYFCESSAPDVSVAIALNGSTSSWRQPSPSNTAVVESMSLDQRASPVDDTSRGKPNGGRIDMTSALLVIQSATEAHHQFQQQQSPREQSGKTVSAYGNYKNYYGYRGTADSDPRLQVMERCWFANKRCIDVGCNSGLVSLAIAARFGTAAMLGLDIDGALIRTASIHLARRRTEVATQLTAGRQKKDAAVVRMESASLRALKGVWFQQADIAAANCPVKPDSCDIALALSVTKWIHINGGDAGLLRYFSAVHAALVPGGLFVLEPQPWRSYKQAVKKQNLVTGLQSSTLDSLKVRPDDFVDMLHAKGQFRLVRQLLEPGSVSRGFASRPMYLLERM